jgi:hypothetical protein
MQPFRWDKGSVRQAVDPQEGSPTNAVLENDSELEDRFRTFAVGWLIVKVRIKILGVSNQQTKTAR